MSASSKILQAGAFGNELSFTGKEHEGWGKTPAFEPLKPLGGFPYLTFEHDPEPVLERDASINSKAFQTGEREVGRTLDKALSFQNRAEGIDKQLAWLFGWEGRTRAIWVTQVEEALEEEQIVELTNFVRQYQTRTITNKLINWAVFTPSGDIEDFADVLDAEGVVAVSTEAMFEHTYEISDDGRAMREFTTEEKVALGTQTQVGDVRTCMASLAKKFPSYFMVFRNTKAYKFGFTWSPASFTEISCNWLGYDQERFPTSQTSEIVDWNMNCPMVEANNIFAHNQTRVEIGQGSYNGLNYPFYPVTDMSLEVETPLQKQQDTESGLFLTDPVLSGQIAITSEMTITHNKDQQFMEWRDNRTPLSARISSTFGAYSQEILIKKFTLTKAGADDGDVAAEPLGLSIELTCGGHNFENWLNGYNEIMGSPIVMRVVNKNPYNEMTGRNDAGAMR